jgi:hypothetical protein
MRSRLTTAAGKVASEPGAPRCALRSMSKSGLFGVTGLHSPGDFAALGRGAAADIRDLERRIVRGERGAAGAHVITALDDISDALCRVRRVLGFTQRGALTRPLRRWLTPPRRRAASRATRRGAVVRASWCSRRARSRVADAPMRMCSAAEDAYLAMSSIIFALNANRGLYDRLAEAGADEVRQQALPCVFGCMWVWRSSLGPQLSCGSPN